MAKQIVFEQDARDECAVGQQPSRGQGGDSSEESSDDEDEQHFEEGDRQYAGRAGPSSDLEAHRPRGSGQRRGTEGSSEDHPHDL